MKEDHDRILQALKEARAGDVAEIVTAALLLEQALYAKKTGADGNLFRLRKALEGIWGHDLPEPDEDWHPGLEEYDPMTDLIASNQEQITQTYREGVRRAQKVIRRPDIGLLVKINLVEQIFDAVATFHPMHGESWGGWPAGTE